MAMVRVLADRSGSDRAPIPRIAYRAQIYEDDVLADPVWTCDHEHRTPIEAQTCGVQYLTDRVVGPPRGEELQAG